MHVLGRSCMAIIEGVSKSNVQRMMIYDLFTMEAQSICSCTTDS